MAIYSSREVISKRWEWTVPSGANIAEFQKAVASAWSSFRTLKGLPEDARWPSDDWCEVSIGSHHGDDGLVISFVTEAPDTAPLVLDDAARERAYNVALAPETILEGVWSNEREVRVLVDQILDAAAGTGKAHDA